MKLVFASDSFKGSLTSEQTAELLAKAARAVFGESVECIGIPVADGGEGTTEVLAKALGGRIGRMGVQHPYTGTVQWAIHGDLGGGRAIIEAAQSCGLTLLKENERQPLYTSSFGLGTHIRGLLDKGYRDIYIALGGSGTNDGGLGALRALGADLYDEEGGRLAGRGADLLILDHLDVSGLKKELKEARFTVLSDVDNPLTGENGATMTFGPQKGADADELEALEYGMCRYRDIVRRDLGADMDEIRGGGAAGGLGAMLVTFLNAGIKSGIHTVLDLVGFDERIEGADLVVTGEGRADFQSSRGKVMMGVGERAMAKHVPAIGLCGSIGPGAEMLYEHGICSLMTTVNAPMFLKEALERAEDLYYEAAVRMFRMLQTGALIERNE